MKDLVTLLGGHLHIYVGNKKSKKCKMWCEIEKKVIRHFGGWKNIFWV